MNNRRPHFKIRPLSASQHLFKRVASRFFLFVVLFSAASLFVLPDRLAPNASTDTVQKKQINQETSMPTLRGEEAVEHLKQQGSYHSLQEAMAAVTYEAKWQAKPLLAVALKVSAFMQAGKAPAAQTAAKKEVMRGQAQNPMPAAPVKTPLLPSEASLDCAQPELDFQKGDSVPVPPSGGSKSPAGNRLGLDKSLGLATATTCNGGGGLWSSPATWSTGMVPTAADDVTIGSGCTVTIDTAAVASSVTIQSSGTLQFEAATARTLTVGQSVTINSGGAFTAAATGAVTTHVLSVGGDLTNNGTLDFSTNGNTAGAGIVFTGAADASFTLNSGSSTDLRQAAGLTLNKGMSSAPVLTFTPGGTFTVQGVNSAGFLSIINGTFKPGGSNTFSNPVFNAAAYTIPATAGFWLNNPNFTVVGQNGSPTNNGFLRISNGTFIAGQFSTNGMGAGAGAVFTIEGGTFNVSGRLQTTSAVTYNQSGGTVNVSTAGGATSSGSFGFSSTSSIINMSGGTINLVQASTAAPTPIDYQFSGFANITGGTLNVGTAATSSNFTFRIQGQMPNVVINNTTNNKTAILSGQGNVWGNLTINTGTTLNLNSQALLMIGQTLTNNGAINVSINNTGSLNFAGGMGTGAAQTYQGTGTFGFVTQRVGSFSLQNTAGVTIAAGVSPLTIYRINAFFGQITNSNRITLGEGDATGLVIQRGATGTAAPAGNLDGAPTFNIGSGGLTLVYSQGNALITTGPEIPSSRSVLGIQIANPLGVTLAGGTLTATNTTSGLLLSSGTLNTSAANLLTISATTTGAISGGSAATYVNGPLARTLPASLASGSTYTFPVGKGSFKMLELVNPTTTAGGAVTIRAEVFDTDSGGSGGSGLLDIFHNRYWSAAITAGAANFTNAAVRLTEQVTPGVNAIGQSATQAGAYNSIGGTVTQPTIGPSSTVTSLGFFAVGVLPGAVPMSGNFNAGSGGDFPTLTAAVAALNSRILNGPVTIRLTDSTYTSETFPITINANAGSSPTNTITIKPAVGASPMISGSSATALVIINGADYVTIDGSNTVGGSSRNLTFTNTNAGTSSAVIWGQTAGTSDPATNNTIKNLNVVGNASTTTLVGIGFGSSTIGASSLGTRNDNNRVQNNNITKTQFGIYDQGASSSNKNLGTVITGNQLGGSGANALGRAGIFVGFEDGVQITNNVVNGVTAGNSADVFGIALGSFNISTTAFTTNNDVANATVTGNFINSVVKTDTFSAAGISMATNNYGTSRIANNAISGINANSTSGDFAAGIYVGGSTAAPTQVYFNSVSMTGLRDTGGTATSPSFALAVLGSNPLVDIRDNALYNTQTSAGTGSNSYAIGFASAPTLFSNITSNYNDLYTSGAQSAFARTNNLAVSTGTDFTTLSAWQSAVGKDANSLSIDPQFTSATDLHLQTTSPVLSNGTAIAVTNDIDNDPRPASNPDIGADELVQATAGMIAGGTYYNVLAGDGDALTGNVTITNTVTLNGKLSTGANTLALGCNATVIGAGTGNYVIGNLKKTYCSAGSFDFAIGTANGFSPVTVNITAGTFPTDFTVKAVEGPQPNLGTPSLALQRYWTLTGAGVTADLTFHYLDPTDIPGTANENNFVILRYDGSFTQPGGSVNTSANTASITGVTSFSDWTLGEAGAPTYVALIAFTAETLAASPDAPQGGVMLRWQTGFETNNLGFHLYREEAGKRTPITPQLLAGSALRAGGSITLQSGESYTWWDNATSANAAYWLEDIDLNGTSTWHGPFYTKAVGGTPPSKEQAALLSKMGSSSTTDSSRVMEKTAPVSIAAAPRSNQQISLAGQAAIKIAVAHEGWYRLTQAELVTAGLPKDVEAQRLQLYVDGRELPMLVNTGKDGRFDETASIEFYGLGIDTPSTDMRPYWLTVGTKPGKRISQSKGEGVSSISSSFTQTIERRDRSIYFAALLNGDKENFFGAVVATQGVDQTLTLTHLTLAGEVPATLEVVLQGVTQTAHLVLVQLNGVSVGYLDYNGQQQGTGKFTLPPASLRDGVNTVRLLSQNGASDVSLVDHIRLSHPHTYTADDNILSFTAVGNQRLTIDGFTSKAIRVFDVTDASNPQELLGDISMSKAGAQITIAPTERGERTLLALTDEQVKTPLRLLLNQGSNWRSESNAADFVILSQRDFFPALEPLKGARESDGLRVALIDIEDLYDEFNFGTKSVQAVRDFFSYAKTKWKQAPRFALLVGDASFDPKNYLGYGDHDLLPTKLLDTDYLETASDDWLADFNNDGIGDLGLGRLPVRSLQEATQVVQKILSYDRAKPSGSALLVADRNDGFDFEQVNRQLRDLLPTTLKIAEINRSTASDEQTKRDLLAALNGGAKLVNYAGHGSVSNWNGNLLTVADASALTNREQLSVFVMMNCLNGYFQEATSDSLAEALLLSEGGAVAVWASSGLTSPQDQAAMNQALYRLLFSTNTLRLGEAIQRAKAMVNNGDVRRTWTLLGDPTLRIR